MKPERVQPPMVYYRGGLGPAPDVPLRDALLPSLQFDGGARRLRRPPTVEDAEDLLVQAQCFCAAYPEGEAAEALGLDDDELDALGVPRVVHGGAAYVLADAVTLDAALVMRASRVEGPGSCRPPELGDVE